MQFQPWLLSLFHPSKYPPLLPPWVALAGIEGRVATCLPTCRERILIPSCSMEMWELPTTLWAKSKFIFKYYCLDFWYSSFRKGLDVILPCTVFLNDLKLWSYDPQRAQWLVSLYRIIRAKMLSDVHPCTSLRLINELIKPNWNFLVANICC